MLFSEVNATRREEVNKIAICIPTYKNDDNLMETINSILDNYQENWIILIGDQNKIENWSVEKRIFYSTACAQAHTFNPIMDRIKVHQTSYNPNQTYQELISLANDLEINYCLIMNDTIKFTKSMRRLNELVKYMKRYDVIVLDDNKMVNPPKCKNCSPKKMVIWKHDTVSSFFVTKTELLKNNIYDTNFFSKIKQQGYKVGYTDRLKGI